MFAVQKELAKTQGQNECLFESIERKLKLVKSLGEKTSKDRMENLLKKQEQNKSFTDASQRYRWKRKLREEGLIEELKQLKKVSF